MGGNGMAMLTNAVAASPVSNKDIVEELYDVFRSKDYDAFRRICTPDLEWIQNEGFPHGATHRGPDAVINNVFNAFHHEWDTFSFRIEQLFDAGTTVIVLGAYVGRHRATQKDMRAAAAHVYDLRDGKIFRFRMFADTKTIWAALEGPQNPSDGLRAEHL